MDVIDLYKRWLAQPLEDADLKAELESIRGQQGEISERFYRDLSFGTAGLRGVIGAGTNRMNLYTIRRATQGLAEVLKKHNPNPVVAISFDSRIKSDLFAKQAAMVLAANGIKVWIYRELMPVPALSFATRRLACDAGIMVTASHNPAKYNGYKVYGSDGCQLTEGRADEVLAAMNRLDVFDGAKLVDYEQAIKKDLIRYILPEVVDEFVGEVLSQQILPGVCREASLKLVYSPLNGAGNKPVRRVLEAIGATNVEVVPSQELPDGNFPTCPFPNPEIKEALAEGLKLSRQINADLMLATDPDCDRVGIAVKDGGEFKLLTGNQVGALLFDYICRNRKESNTLPKDPIAVTTIVSTRLTDAIGAAYGVEVIKTLTGFKYIGEQIALVEQEGRPQRFIFGFEESYGYLAGTHVRDKDAVVGSMLIVEMASWYKTRGMTLMNALDELYKTYGLCCESVDNFTFEGEQGMKLMDAMMQKLRSNPPKKIANQEVTCLIDYEASSRTDAQGVSQVLLPKSNVLEYTLENGCTAIVRPSGTEPKIKLYLSLVGKDMAEIERRAAAIGEDVERLLGIKQ